MMRKIFLEKDLFTKRITTICHSTNRVVDCKVFLFIHPEVDRNEEDYSYQHWIGRNDGLAAAIVVGEESRGFFFSEKRKKIVLFP